MKEILAKLWRGEIAPIDERIDDARRGELMDALDACESALGASLTEESAPLLEKWQDKHTELSYIECEDAFVKGFSLGFRIALGVLADRD